MFAVNIVLAASRYILPYFLPPLPPKAGRVTLAADMAEEKLPHSARLIQSGGLFSGKKSWQRVMTFRKGVGVGLHIAMPTWKCQQWLRAKYVLWLQMTQR